MNQLAPWIQCVFSMATTKCTGLMKPRSNLGLLFLSYWGQVARSLSIFFATAANLLQVTIAFVLKIFSFSDKKRLVLDAFDRQCWDAACCSRMSESRDFRCSWLAVKWCSTFPLFLWLYVWSLDLLFFIVKFLYFQVFHNFHIFTLNWYSQLFQISVFADTLRIFASPHVG